ncbi:hypothetical protein ACPWSR_07475 [Alloiococcus sp. CFN-8]|uniref:hypothetical protein n=1 Tax=Alloiococcus sp. CFN-8 TaxID=3416081 RepID=UPI003CFB05B6
MDIIMISPYVFILILLLLNLKIFFPETFTGRLLIEGRKPKVREKLGFTIMYIIMIVFFSVFLIVYIMRYITEKNPYNENDVYLFQILLCVFWVINIFIHIIRGFKPVAIREKGIFIENGIFIKFKKIYSYKWKSQNVLELDSKRVFKLGDDYQIKFKDEEEALNFDSILQKYVKKI